MCSVSWCWELDNGEHTLSVLFNRDERKSREIAEAPKALVQQDVTILLPIDKQRGGTWIAANDQGLCVALLNNYAVPVTPGKSYMSRGELVKKIARCSSFEDAHVVLDRCVDQNSVPPFDLIIWDINLGNTHFYAWNELALEEFCSESNFLTSSSWNTNAVQSYRHELFEKLVEKGQMTAHDFHFNTIENRAEWSVCMMREDTQTVSITEVTMSSSTISMRYFDRTNGLTSESNVSR